MNVGNMAGVDDQLGLHGFTQTFSSGLNIVAASGTLQGLQRRT
jgi:hypothetical protein